jgi:hypothetical protein
MMEKSLSTHNYMRAIYADRAQFVVTNDGGLPADGGKLNW